jgi:hypothetical protein
MRDVVVSLAALCGGCWRAKQRAQRCTLACLVRAWPCKTLIAPNTTAEIVGFSPVRRTPYAEGCVLPGKRPLHPLLYVPHPLTTARLGSSSSSTQTSAAAAAATLPPLPAPTMLLGTIHVTGALAVATFALSALLAAADSTLNAIASSRSRRRYMFPTIGCWPAGCAQHQT